MDILNVVRTNYTISVVFKNTTDAFTFMFTGVYGPSIRTDRDIFFEELSQIKTSNRQPWILNEVTHNRIGEEPSTLQGWSVT